MFSSTIIAAQLSSENSGLKLKPSAPKKRLVAFRSLTGRLMKIIRIVVHSQNHRDQQTYVRFAPQTSSLRLRLGQSSRAPAGRQKVGQPYELGYREGLGPPRAVDRRGLEQRRAAQTLQALAQHF